MTNEIPNKNPDCIITSTRIFDADQKLVFKAWTTPEYLKKWWGPKGFTNTFHEYDLRSRSRGFVIRVARFVSPAEDYDNQFPFL